MKRIVLALVIFLAACAPSDTSVRLLGASPLDPTCKVQSGGVTITNGTLNLALTNRYYAQFGTESDLQVIVTQVGSDTLQGPGRNDFIGDRFVFSYTSTPTSPFPDETEPVYVIIPAGAGGSSSSQDNFLQTNLISTKAGEALYSKVVAGGTPMDLVVNFQVQGHLFSGESINTNQVSFPITVYNLPPPAQCPAGTTLTAVPGPCGNTGQDGDGFTCS
jgi:hypothetical protein